MTGVIIGAGEESLHAIKTAQEMNHSVVALDGNPYASGMNIANVAITTDIRNPDNIIKELERRNIVPDFIFYAPIGRYLISSGYIADHYNLKAPTGEVCELCTDKYLFHQCLTAQNLRNAECHLLNADLPITIPNITYPAIIKPRYGSGNRNVTMLSAAADIDTSIIPNEDYIAETILAGQEYGLDAAVIDSKFIPILLRKKKMTPVNSLQCVAYFSVTDIILYNIVEKYMINVVDTLKLDNCLLHADLMIDNQSISAIEIAPRPSGHYLHDIFTPLTTGVDMIHEYIQYVCGGRHSFNPMYIRQTAIHYFDFEDCVITHKPSSQELSEFNIIKYKCNIGSQRIEKITDGHSLMNRGYFIVEGNSQLELEVACDAILHMFKKEQS